MTTSGERRKDDDGDEEGMGVDRDVGKVTSERGEAPLSSTGLEWHFLDPPRLELGRTARDDRLEQMYIYKAESAISGRLFDSIFVLCCGVVSLFRKKR